MKKHLRNIIKGTIGGFVFSLLIQMLLAANDLGKDDVSIFLTIIIYTIFINKYD